MLVLLILSNPISAAEPPSTQETEKKIVSYLSSHSLVPLIGEGEFQYYFLGLIEGYPGSTFAMGNITKDKVSYNALFMMKNGSRQADLAYLTTDTPLSPRLFADILPGALALLSKEFFNLPPLIVPLKKGKGVHYQKWIFCSKKNQAELFVRLTDDGKGGTYFDVSKSNL